MNRYDKKAEIPLTKVEELRAAFMITDRVVNTARKAKKAAYDAWEVARDVRYDAYYAYMTAKDEEAKK